MIKMTIKDINLDILTCECGSTSWEDIRSKGEGTITLRCLECGEISELPWMSY